MPSPASDQPSSHYFSERPGATSAPRLVRMRLAEGIAELVTDRGVFSPGHLDPGTRVLLDAVPPPPAAGDVLDLGCGYGPVALALAQRAPGATVWAVDVNERARELTAGNAERLGFGNVRVAAPDEVPADVRFAAIWSNPPVRVGKAALHDLLVRWLDRLAEGGTAHLVVQKHLGGDSLHRWLSDQGYDVRRLASKRGYRVLEVGARSLRG